MDEKITHSDVILMRDAAEWIESDDGGRAEWEADEPGEPDSFAALANRCRSIADRVEAALVDRVDDDDSPERIADEWPDEAGPWK
jgi:hypothetical protein